MAHRIATKKRQQQIVEAALALLAEVPLERLTTRLVAARVGVSQPALFRHFRSRDQILVAVADFTSRELASRVQAILEQPAAPLPTLGKLAELLFSFAGEHPGMPQFLFQDVTHTADAPYHQPLRRLVAMQRELVSTLIHEAAEEGTLSVPVDEDGAATIFVALVQGLLLQRRHAGIPIAPREDGKLVIGVFLAALRAGHPPAQAAATTDGPPSAPAQPIVTLDVRPLIKAGTDPLVQILAARQQVPTMGALVLTVPFRPAPLLTLMEARGDHATCRQVGKHLFVVEVTSARRSTIEDLSGLEPPEPMERVLGRSAKLSPGDGFLVRLPRYPRLLLPRLEERGLRWQMEELPEGTALLFVGRAP